MLLRKKKKAAKKKGRDSPLEPVYFVVDRRYVTKTPEGTVVTRVRGYYRRRRSFWEALLGLPEPEPRQRRTRRRRSGKRAVVVWV